MNIDFDVSENIEEFSKDQLIRLFCWVYERYTLDFYRVDVEGRVVIEFVPNKEALNDSGTDASPRGSS